MGKTELNRVLSFFEALKNQVPWGKTCEICVMHLNPDGIACSGNWTIAFETWDDALRAMENPISGGIIGGGCKTCGSSGLINSDAKLRNYAHRN